jgi:DnaJ like chaperone protein
VSPRVLAVIFLGLIAGYWIVSALQNWMSRASGPPPTRPRPGFTPPLRSSGDAPDPSAWFTVLGVPESANLEDITSAYKRKISEYHPDKVARTAVEIQQLAESRSKQINAAYDHAMKLKRNERGVPT